tara:strand:- start:1093 stop:2010 length:918 start_codon:yes stop_codon:yes gene_type:complete
MILTYRHLRKIIREEWCRVLRPGMILESLSYFGSGFVKFKGLVDSGMDPHKAARDVGFKQIGKGFTRRVYEHPSSQEFVLKVAHGAGHGYPDDFDQKRFNLALRTNRDEAKSGRDATYKIFPKVYPGDAEGNWILSEKVIPLEFGQLAEFFPEVKFTPGSMAWLAVLDLGKELAKELSSITASGDWSKKPTETQKKIDQLSDSSTFGKKFSMMFSDLWDDNPTFKELTKAMADYGIAPQEVRSDNLGIVLRDGKEQLVLLDVSVGLDRSISTQDRAAADVEELLAEPDLDALDDDDVLFTDQPWL